MRTRTAETMEAQARARADEIKEHLKAGNMSRSEAEHENDSLETFADELAPEAARAAAPVANTPFVIPGELIRQIEAWCEIVEVGRRGILD